MNAVHRALMAHPLAPEVSREERSAEAECIRACIETAESCLIGADACVEEDAVAELRECLRAQQDCAALCTATAEVLARRGFPESGGGSAVLRSLLETCREAARVCGHACDEHAEAYEHCAVSAEAARRCEQACAELLAEES
ncbi:four-helix bundle copper-binding protein [Kocuria sp. M1R5S2]|uniref:four-helix bundle copper-binding protein n=1 Tax=Kocuria rhizosphaerae TaxID=3376285 RepID=UPI00379AD77B